MAACIATGCGLRGSAPLTSFLIVSKDKPQLGRTLEGISGESRILADEWKVIVVDASRGRREEIRARHPSVRWFDYKPPLGVRASIPHQRNVGVQHARGELIVFTDCGCEPEPGWLGRLLHPILLDGEDVAVGRTVGRRLELYDGGAPRERHLRECSTINMAVRRSVVDTVGQFDEGFEYGSDVDFAWRLVDAAVRLRSAPGAVLTTDWGNVRRQLRRAWLYGRARASLYMKHRIRLPTCFRDDPAPFAYTAFPLGLPLTAAFPFYPALLSYQLSATGAPGPSSQPLTTWSWVPPSCVCV